MFLLLVLIIVVLFVFAAPVAFAIAIACLFYILSSGIPILTLAQKMVYGLNSFTLLAIPLFILAANILSAAKLTDRIFNFAGKLVGHIRGGMAHANIVASIIFAGMSGAALADVAGLGRVEIKAMEEDGFETDFAAAVTAASSAVGPIIPPIVAGVVYGASLGISIGRILIGGIIPGILLGIVLIIITWFIASIKKMPTKIRASIKEIWVSFRKAFLALLSPVIMIGGILSGIFTPTESAAIAVLYSLILGIFIYKTLKLKDLKKIIIDSVIGTAVVCIIVSASCIFGWIGTIERLPHLVGLFFSGLSNSPIIVLLVIDAFLLLIGCLIEMTPILIILPPILYPMLINLGIDPIHFGIVMVFNITIGLFTPPFGIGMFVLLDITGRPMGGFIKQFFPYFITLIGFLLFLIFTPQIVTWLPNLILGK